MAIDDTTPTAAPTELAPLLGLLGQSGSALGLARLLGSDASSAPLNADPLSQIGAVLAGFGSGMRGQSNPVLEMLVKRREQDLSRRLAFAQLGLSAQQAAATEAHQKAVEEQNKATLKQRQTEFQANTANQMLAEARAVGSSELFTKGLDLLHTAAGLPMPNDATLAPIRTRMDMEAYSRNAKEMVLAVSMGAPDDSLMMRQVRQTAPWLLQAKPEQLATLRKTYGIPDSTVAQLDEENARLNTAAANESLLAAQRVRAAALAGRSPEPADMLLSGQKYTTGELATLGLVYKKQGIPVPNWLQPHVDNWELQLKHLQTGTATSEMATDLHREQLKILKEHGPLDQAAEFLTKLVAAHQATIVAPGMDEKAKETLQKTLATLVARQTLFVQSLTGKQDAVTQAHQEAAARADAILAGAGKEKAKATVPSSERHPDLEAEVPGPPSLIDQALKKLRQMPMRRPRGYESVLP